MPRAQQQLLPPSSSILAAHETAGAADADETKITPSSKAVCCSGNRCAETGLICLILACVFFAVYDAMVRKILWSQAIYWPLVSLFSCGIYGFAKPSVPALRVFSVMLGSASAGLLCYGVYLCFQPQWWWGVVTLIALVLVVPLAYNAWHCASRHETSDDKVHLRTVAV